MEKFRHTLRRWRSAFLKNERGTVTVMPPLPIPSRETSPLPLNSRVDSSLPASELADDSWNPYLEPLLDLSTITISRTWKDIPQEIVNIVIFMLGRDLRSLKACSLTCRALFLSARPFIHKKMCLTSELNWEVLTPQEKERYIRGELQGLVLKTLSGAAAHGLLQFCRHLLIHINQNFTPTNLLPFIDHFQRFDRLQELSIYYLPTRCFVEHFDPFFTNFVPTLRSLHLDMPDGNGQDILNFICRFPHLDDLTLQVSESPQPLRTLEPASLSPSIAKEIPPFRGRLRLDRIYWQHHYMLQELMSLPGKPCFRFLDFRCCPIAVEQPIIDALSGTMETLSITWNNFYPGEGLPLNLANAQNLRSLTLGISLVNRTGTYESLSQTIRAISSPFFSEFILEVENVWWTLCGRQLRTSAELDKMFEAMDKERGFKVIIRTETVEQGTAFIALSKEWLPLMSARERVIIEVGPFPEK